MILKPGDKIFLTLILSALLFFQNAAFAFPKKSELQPYGKGVVVDGFARLSEDSGVEYIETYIDDPLEDTIRATYWSPDQELLSYKKLDFTANWNIPDYYEAIDYRRRKGFRITVVGDVANVQMIHFYKDNVRQKILLNENVNIDDTTVIDASFHRYVISNWDKLLDGKTVRVKFLQIDKARLVPLKIKRSACDTDGAVCFKISLDNFILQAMVPTIYMEYEETTQRLIRYTGIGPLTKRNGKALPVDIVYEYPQ